MIFDDKRLRFITLCAFLNEEISTLIEKDKLKEGEICIDDKDNFVKNSILKIQEIMNKRAYTKTAIKMLDIRFPQVGFYYDLISDTIKKHIKVGEKWIPSLVILSCIQEYSLRGYKCFNEIDFNSCIDKFIFDNRAEHKQNLNIALDIVETLINIKVPKKNKYKRISR